MRYLFVLLALLIMPSQALAHGTKSTSEKPSSSLPRVTLLSAQKHYQGEQAEMPALLASSLALIVRNNHLRVSILRGKNGSIAYQQLGNKRLRLPANSFEMTVGMIDAWRIRLYQNDKLVEQSSLSWCLDGTAPLNQGRLINDPLPASCGTPTSLKITSGIDRRWMAALPEPYQVSFNSIDNSVDANSDNPMSSETFLRRDLSETAPLIETPGKYRLEIIFDPKRILRLSNDSRRRLSFTVDVPGATARPMTLSRKAMIPDLKALPPTSIDLISGKGYDLLSFNSVVWNAGRGPVIVRGRRNTLSGTRMPAYQTLVDSEARPTETRRIGNLVWDVRDGHNHWHYNGLARYSLLDAKGREVARSGKVGFCFVNTDPINSDYFHPKAYRLRYDQVGNMGCGMRFSLSAYMQLDSGWGDQYGQALPGQAIDISKIPNGRYYLRVLVNAGREAKIYESNYRNNSASRRITLSGSSDERQVAVKPWYGEGY